MIAVRLTVNCRSASCRQCTGRRRVRQIAAGQCIDGRDRVAQWPHDAALQPVPGHKRGQRTGAGGRAPDAVPGRQAQRHQQQRLAAHQPAKPLTERRIAQQSQQSIRRQAGTHDAPAHNGQSTRFVVGELSVQRAGGLDLFARGRRAHRHISCYLAALADRCHIGHHPVKVAVLAAVLDQAGPRLAALERAPHIGKGLGRHGRMTHQIVSLAQEFDFRKAADLDKRRIHIGDAALGICLRNNRLAWLNPVFGRGDGLIVTHCALLEFP
jgi:hypothetical protein